jgi:methylenetetrahydrofolate reductase (NADPH)
MVHTSTLRPDDASAACEVELVSSGSLEIGGHAPEDVAAVASCLPVGTAVFVNHLPRQPLVDTLTTLRAARDAGLDPVPHIAARRVASREELAAYLEQAVGKIGVRRALVIGGDMPNAAGPYQDAEDLLADPAFAGAGIRQIGLATYPEGHPRIAKEALEGSLRRKLDLIASRDASPFLVTQFAFAPVRVVEHCAYLHRRHPGVPIYVGIAGPASPKRLMYFAQRCGVSASLRALQAQGFGAVRLLTHTDPGAQLRVIAQHCVSRTLPNVVGVHFFSFGGAQRTAQFMLSVLSSGREG